MHWFACPPIFVEKKIPRALRWVRGQNLFSDSNRDWISRFENISTAPPWSNIFPTLRCETGKVHWESLTFLHRAMIECVVSFEHVINLRAVNANHKNDWVQELLQTFCYTVPPITTLFILQFRIQLRHWPKKDCPSQGEDFNKRINRNNTRKLNEETYKRAKKKRKTPIWTWQKKSQQQ